MIWTNPILQRATKDVFKFLFIYTPLKKLSIVVLYPVLKLFWCEYPFFVDPSSISEILNRENYWDQIYSFVCTHLYPPLVIVRYIILAAEQMKANEKEDKKMATACFEVIQLDTVTILFNKWCFMCRHRMNCKFSHYAHWAVRFISAKFSFSLLSQTRLSRLVCRSTVVVLSSVVVIILIT